MNRRRAAAVAVAAALVLTGFAGAMTAFGPPAGPEDAPGTPTATPTDTPASEGTSIDHEGDALTLANAPGQVVAGTTDVEAGSNVTVRVFSTGSEQPFLVQTVATVDRDGTFRATVDLSGVAAGTEATVAVLHDGEELTNATVHVEASGRTATEAPTDAGATLDYEGDVLTLRAAPGQTVAGTTDLEPGTEVTVRLQSSDAGAPFLKSATATVREDGTFEASFNLSGVDPGVGFTVAVLHDGEELAAADGEVVEAE